MVGAAVQRFIPGKWLYSECGGDNGETSGLHAKTSRILVQQQQCE